MFYGSGVATGRRRLGCRAAFCIAAFSGGVYGIETPDSAAIDALTRMSLTDLANVPVTSVSKVAEPLRRAPAAIYVISHEDILRSGVTSLPEALRLAPNLLVTQLTSSNYVVAARGLGGNPAAQNFANKLLILIDGRSVYTPLFSGVYHDAQDVMIDDIERIEVISGPGATLWGANAMNGVINIITRSSHETMGTIVAAGGGNLEQGASARYGGAINNEASYRVYGKGFRRGAMELANGSSAEDDWYKGQAGFRFDWSATSDAFTVQGDAYRGLESELDAGKLAISGANALTRWQHQGAGYELQIQAYYDRTERDAPGDGVAFILNTYDVEVQHSFLLGESNRIVWGAGQRFNDYSIENSAALLFEPSDNTLQISNFFAQDTIALTGSINLTLGLKFEKHTLSDWELQPDARLSWQPTPTVMLWSAASRAIRAPTPFDHDVVEKIGSTVFLTRNAGFDPEVVNAFEIGYRGEPTATTLISVSVFYNDYDDLRTIEPDKTTFIPLRWDNEMEGHAYGITAWAKWQATPWWRIGPGFTLMRTRLKFSQSASGILGVAQAANDPSSHALISSTMNLPRGVSFDNTLRYVASLPEPYLPHYYELGSRLAWQVSRGVELSLSGFNLLHSDHREYPAPAGVEIGRSVIAAARWRF